MPAMKPSRRLSRGATRRSRSPDVSKFDRWLNMLVSLFVVVALVVGGLALILTLIFG